MDEEIKKIAATLKNLGIVKDWSEAYKKAEEIVASKAEKKTAEEIESQIFSAKKEFEKDAALHEEEKKEITELKKGIEKTLHEVSDVEELLKFEEKKKKE